MHKVIHFKPKQSQYDKALDFINDLTIILFDGKITYEQYEDTVKVTLDEFYLEDFTHRHRQLYLALDIGIVTLDEAHQILRRF